MRILSSVTEMCLRERIRRIEKKDPGLLRGFFCICWLSVPSYPIVSLIYKSNSWLSCEDCKQYWKYFHQSRRDFPGGPVVMILLPMQRVQVRYLFGELRSHMLRGLAKKRKGPRILPLRGQPCWWPFVGLIPYVYLNWVVGRRFQMGAQAGHTM